MIKSGCKSLVLCVKTDGHFGHERVNKNKKRSLTSVLSFQKIVQNEVTLEGTFINYEGSVKGFLEQMLQSLRVR